MGSNIIRKLGNHLRRRLNTASPRSQLGYHGDRLLPTRRVLNRGGGLRTRMGPQLGSFAANYVVILLILLEFRWFRVL